VARNRLPVGFGLSAKLFLSLSVSLSRFRVCETERPFYSRHDDPDIDRSSGANLDFGAPFPPRRTASVGSAGAMRDFIAISTVPWDVLSLLLRDRSDLRLYTRGYLRGPRAGQERRTFYVHVCTAP